MEQIEPISDTENAALPVVPEKRWDPEKAAKPKVKVIKTPYEDDPMKEKTVFQIFGSVYICYAKKTRGRSMIRYLGKVEPVEAGGNHGQS